ncbi:MAG: hypothetical protein U0840_20210 [Gemmataceae bacterium]
MKLRMLALLALMAALVPAWADGLVVQDTRINRMRITTVTPEAGGPPAAPRTSEYRQNRMRITTILDVPGTVRSLLPQDRQLDRSRFDNLPKPRSNPRTPGRILEVPPAQPLPRPKAVDKEEVNLEVPNKPVADDGSTMREETLKVKEWKGGRQIFDSLNRRWHLIQGTPHRDTPVEMRGWLMQAEGSPVYFFSRTGRMWRMTSVPPI